MQSGQFSHSLCSVLLRVSELHSSLYAKSASWIIASHFAVTHSIHFVNMSFALLRATSSFASLTLRKIQKKSHLFWTEWRLLGIRKGIIGKICRNSFFRISNYYLNLILSSFFCQFATRQICLFIFDFLSPFLILSGLTGDIPPIAEC